MSIQTKYPTLIRMIAVQVPIERFFDFYRMMKENQFECHEIWSFSDFPETFKELSQYHKKEEKESNDNS